MKKIVILNDGETWSPIDGVMVVNVTSKMWEELEGGADLSSFRGVNGDFVEELISDNEELQELKNLNRTLETALIEVLKEVQKLKGSQG